MQIFYAIEGLIPTLEGYAVHSWMGIANWHSPVLAIHGDDDRNVPFQQTTDLVEKLRAQNVAFEELTFPDEIHELLRWSDWVRAYRANAEFFDRRLASSGERQ